MATVIYLSGAIRPVSHKRLGWMLNPNMGNRLPSSGWWALDNGAFSSTFAFSWDRFQRVAERLLAEAGDRCLFIVAPDVPFDADGTQKRWEQYGQQARRLGAPVAFVTQDGMGYEDIPWVDVDALFVGGSTEWKLGHESTALMQDARQAGKWVHVGRVNSLSRMRAAFTAGAQSADGTFLKYGPDVNWPRLKGWLDTMTEQPLMRLYA